jgi:hypothetical protein
MKFLGFVNNNKKIGEENHNKEIQIFIRFHNIVKEHLILHSMNDGL